MLLNQNGQIFYEDPLRIPLERAALRRLLPLKGMRGMLARNRESKMQKLASIGVLVLANGLFPNAPAFAQEPDNNADQPLSAEEAAENSSGGAPIISCPMALEFEAGFEDGMLITQVSYQAESFLAAVLISTSDECFSHGDNQILIGSLANLGLGSNSSYSADIDMNGYDGPLWMQVLVLTEDCQVITSDTREIVHRASEAPDAEEAPSGDESGASDN